MIEKFVIFSDLDGTLLDHSTYSYEAAKPALALVAEKEIPLILTSSKSLAEIEEIQQELEIEHPFIVENGGAICIPTGYFALEKDLPVSRNFEIEFLGPPYKDILRSLSEIRKLTHFQFKGFNDMTPDEVIAFTQLPPDKAEKARNRLCSEPLVWADTNENLEKFTENLKKRGLKLLKGGRFYHLMGNTDKGSAIIHLLSLFRTKYPQVEFKTIGIGDSPNDIEMLNQVNIPVLVQRPDGTYINIPFDKKVIYADGPGPAGWNKAIREILTKN